jgi:hypothetical protein
VPELLYIKLYLKNHISGLSDSVLAMLPIHVWNVFCIIVVGVAYVVVTKPLGAIGQITDTPWVAKMHHETPIEHKVEISIVFTSRHRLAWSTLMFKGMWSFFHSEIQKFLGFKNKVRLLIIYLKLAFSAWVHFCVQKYENYAIVLIILELQNSIT